MGFTTYCLIELSNEGQKCGMENGVQTFAAFPVGPFSRLNALIIEDNILPFARNGKKQPADSLQNSKIVPCNFGFVKLYS